MIRSIYLFVEDNGHEAFLQALIERLAQEYQVDVRIRPYSAIGGHGKVISELKTFVRDLQRDKENLPDLLVVAIDTNCHKLVDCRNEIGKVIPQEIKEFVILALPDPHLERWLLIDSAAFKKVLGGGCSAPDQKCNKDRYKQLLSQAIRDTGSVPILGGIEHASDIVNAMDLEKILGKVDSSLRDLVRGLRNQFKRWQSENR